MSASTVSIAEPTTMPVAALRPHPDNPRGPVDPDTVAELADSIRAQGVLQPLLVTPDGTVLCGHRRLEAARVAGLADVPVVVRDLDPAEAMAVMLVENVQREDLTPIQETRAYADLHRLGLRDADIARRVGVPAGRVSVRRALLRLPAAVQALIDAGDLGVTNAALLLDLPEPGRQKRLALIAARRRLSTKQLRRLIERVPVAGAELPSPTRAAEPALQTPPEPPTSGGSPRAVVAGDLKRGAAAKRAAPFERVYAAFAAACRECGEYDNHAICLDCPALDLARRLAEVGREG